ncbi:putative oxidoreductase [Actinokineospora diospyrosa]|uniref:Oxidoreductase n=2 Tax=Actinokineospora diospyrosa TaxID=103728 RepID=A0ABT1IGD0_9PSEU|nr:putative oxidoreductase [Actinokineospora diospyrosa]
MGAMSVLRNVKRVGYGAMQLAGPGVFGPPADPDAAVAVLRRAVELGVDHIDTSDYYGPYVVNELIARALRPYPADLVIVTKIGARRDDTGNWLPALAPAELRSAVHDNLTRLGVERLDVVNLRVMDESPLEESFAVLAALREEGLVGELGISNVTLPQLEKAREVAPVSCVQNHYNVTERGDDALVDRTNELGIAYVPFFPLGGFQPIQAEVLHTVASRHGATDRQVALAWLLARSPNILLIPGTKTLAHLEQNLAVADIDLTAEDIAELDAIAG